MDFIGIFFTKIRQTTPRALKGFFFIDSAFTFSRMTNFPKDNFLPEFTLKIRLGIDLRIELKKKKNRC